VQHGQIAAAVTRQPPPGEIVDRSCITHILVLHR
jgi:hypothetical protein